MIFDGTEVSIFIAFLAGFVTFFASCLLPLVPTYLAYLSGLALATADTQEQRRVILKTASIFVTGFILAFMLLGITAYHFSETVTAYKVWLERGAGILFILFGAHILGLLKSKILNQEYKFDFAAQFKKHRQLHALAAGFGFGLGWTPCIGPVLAVILFWASRQDTQWQGMTLLLMYGLGLGVPFLLVAAGFERIVPLLKKSAKVTRYLTWVSGGILILAGVLLLTGQFSVLAMLLVELLNLTHLSI